MLPLNYPDSCLFFGMFSGVKSKLKKQRELAGSYFYGLNIKHRDLISSLTLGRL